MCRAASFVAPFTTVYLSHVSRSRRRRPYKSPNAPGRLVQQYKDDCISAFPELRLFFASPEAMATGGRTSETEYQRTMGALFAVYWLVRLGMDGEDGFCNGVNETWNTIKTNTLPTGEDATPLNFFTMTDGEKRDAFRKTMKWAEFANLIDTAG